MTSVLRRMWKRIKDVYRRPATRGDARFGPAIGFA